MAKIIFKIGGSESEKALTPQQFRLNLMNSSGDELMHVKSKFDDFNLKIGFPYGKKDHYVRPDDYPKSREEFIAGKPQTYEQALEKYKRALDLYKSASSSDSKKRALSYLVNCHKHAQVLYQKKLATLRIPQ